MELKVFIVISWGTDKFGDDYTDTPQKSFSTFDLAAQEVSRIKFEWIQDNNILAPEYVKDTHGEFSVYDAISDELEYHAMVKELPFIDESIPLKGIQLFNTADELFHEPFSAFKYSVYMELKAREYPRDLTDQEILHLCDLAIEVLDNYDYSTSTGIGMCIADGVIKLLEEDSTLDLTTLIQGQIDTMYEASSDWK